MKKKFITQIRLGDAQWTGPEILADSWEEAEKIACDLRVELEGESPDA